MNVQDKALSIGKNGCLAFCYLVCLGIEGDAELIRCVSKAMDKGLIDTDCTVKDAEKYLEFFSGKRYSVTKKDITTITDIKELTPVRFDNGAYSHWVVVENGKIIFNSIQESNCVNYGFPTTARVIKLK